MQEKLIEILSRATAWMTAQQIADAGGWRSASNVTVALQQMEKANGQVERKNTEAVPAALWIRREAGSSACDLYLPIDTTTTFKD